MLQVEKSSIEKAHYLIQLSCCNLWNSALKHSVLLFKCMHYWIYFKTYANLWTEEDFNLSNNLKYLFYFHFSSVMPCHWQRKQTAQRERRSCLNSKWWPTWAATRISWISWGAQSLSGNRFPLRSPRRKHFSLETKMVLTPVSLPFRSHRAPQTRVGLDIQLQG